MITSVKDSTEGAALTLACGAAPAFFRFKVLGTNEVASFLKSRSSGSAEMTAAADIGALGLGGNDGCGSNVFAAR